MPCENNQLRNIALDRPSVRIGRYDFLPSDIEMALATVIEKEIDLQRRLEILKREVELRYDYTPLAAFRSIDRYNVGKIDTISLGAYLRANGHHASEIELLAIIRRIDTDGDACLCFNEFAEFMRTGSPSNLRAEPRLIDNRSPIRGAPQRIDYPPKIKS